MDQNIARIYQSMGPLLKTMEQTATAIDHTNHLLNQIHTHFAQVARIAHDTYIAFRRLLRTLQRPEHGAFELLGKYMRNSDDTGDAHIHQLLNILRNLTQIAISIKKAIQPSNKAVAITHSTIINLIQTIQMNKNKHLGDILGTNERPQALQLDIQAQATMTLTIEVNHSGANSLIQNVLEDQIPSISSGFLKRLAAIVAAILVMGGLIFLAGFLTVIKPVVFTLGLAAITAILDSLVVAAHAMKVVDDTAPMISGAFAKKIAAIGLGIIAMGGLAVLAGYLTSLNPSLFNNGLAAIAGIREELVNAAVAMREVDDHAPMISASYAKKLLAIGVAITGMGILAGVVGYLMSLDSSSSLLTNGLAAISQISEQLVEAAIAIKSIDENVPMISDGFALKLASLGAALIVMGGLVVVGGYLKEKKPDILKAGLQAVSMISDSLIEAAKAVAKVDENVPMISDGFALKLASLGTALIGMGGLAIVGGYLQNKKPGVLQAGLQAVSMISDSLIEAANAVAKIDENVPPISLDFATKLATVGAALLGMGAFVTLIGAGVLKTGGMLLVAQALGMLITLGLAATIVTAARAVGEIVEHTPSNLGTVESKIEIIGAALKAVGSQRLSSGLGFIRNLVGMFDVAILAATTTMYAEIGKTLEEIQNLEINKTEVMARVESIGETLQAVAGHNIERGMNIIGNFLGLIDVAILGATVKLYAQIGEEIQKINDLDFCPDRVMEKVDLISEVIEAVRSERVAEEINLLSAFLEAVEISILGKIINTYGEIAETLQKLSEMDFSEADRQAAMDMIDLLMDFVSDLEVGSSSLFERLGRWFSSAPDHTEVEAAREHIEHLKAIAQALEVIQEIVIEPTDVESQMNKLKEAIQHLEGMEDLINGEIDTTLVEQAKLAIENFSKIAEAIQTIQSVTVDRTMVSERIQDMQSTFSYLRRVSFDGRIDTRQVELAKQAMENFAAIASAIETIGEVEIDPALVGRRIGEMQQTFTYLRGLNDIRADEIDTETSEAARQAMQALADIAEAIETIGEIVIDPGHIKIQIERIQETFQHLNTVDDIVDQVEIDTATSEAARDVMQHLAAIAEAIDTIGEVEVDPDLVRDKIEEIQATFQYLTAEHLEVPEDLIDAEVISPIKTVVTHLAEIADALQRIVETTFDSGDIQDRIRELRDEILPELTATKFSEAQNLVEETIMTKIKRVINCLTSTLETLSQFPEDEMNATHIKGEIEKLGQIVEKINATNLELSTEEETLTTSLHLIEQVANLLEKISQLEEIEINKEAICEMLTGAQTVLTAIEAFTSDLLTLELEEATEVVQGIQNLLTDLSNLQADFTEIDIVEKLATSMEEALPRAKEAVINVGDAIKETFQAELTKVKENFIEMDIIGQLITNFEENKQRVETTATAIATTIRTAFETGLDGFSSIGENAMAGLNQGLLSGESAVIATATRIANSITRTMQTALSINSPSRVMRDQIGCAIPEGIAVGIDAEANTVTNALTSLSDDMVQTIKTDPVSEMDWQTMKGTTKHDLTVNYQQLTPQINVEVHTDGGDVDVESLVEQIEDMICEKQNALLLA